MHEFHVALIFNPEVSFSVKILLKIILTINTQESEWEKAQIFVLCFTFSSATCTDTVLQDAASIVAVETLFVYWV